MNKTKIGWTDVSWNPVHGCTRVSDGCRLCYAGYGRNWGAAATPVGSFTLPLPNASEMAASPVTMAGFAVSRVS